MRPPENIIVNSEGQIVGTYEPASPSIPEPVVGEEGSTFDNIMASAEAAAGEVPA